MRRYYQCRADIGVRTLRNGEQKHWTLAGDFAIARGRIYDDLKKYLAMMPAAGRQRVRAAHRPCRPGRAVPRAHQLLTNIDGAHAISNS
jgi:hypothetical protein